MRQLSSRLMVLITTMTLVTGCSVIESFDASPTTSGPAGRVELHEAGIALTFPDDWLIEERPTSDSLAFPSIEDQALRELLTPVVAAVPPSLHDRCVVVDLAPLLEVRSDWSTLDDVVNGYRAMLEADPSWVDVSGVIVDLRAGRTGRLLRTRDGEAESVSSYIFSQAGASFLLECVAHSVPAEDWHAIAATFEFLAPAPASPSAMARLITKT